METEEFLGVQHACRQTDCQIKLSQYFVISSLRQFVKLLRNRCPDDLFKIIEQIVESQRAGDTSAQITAITDAIDFALAARALLNSEEESLNGQMLLTDVVIAAADALSGIAYLRSITEQLYTARQLTESAPSLAVVVGFAQPKRSAA